MWEILCKLKLVVKAFITNNAFFVLQVLSYFYILLNIYFKVFLTSLAISLDIVYMSSPSVPILEHDQKGKKNKKICNLMLYKFIK